MDLIIGGDVVDNAEIGKILKEIRDCQIVIKVDLAEVKTTVKMGFESTEKEICDIKTNHNSLANKVWVLFGVNALASTIAGILGVKQ